MAQIKIYGLKDNLDKNRDAISSSIHDSVMSALEYPKEKKFHRFISLNKDDFIYPDDRSEEYIIIEISMFEGRSIEAKKSLIRELFNNINTATGISSQDIEITIYETPKENWGIRGMPGDELALGYKVEV
ncbi:tautomerase family protein [Enterovibrio norvegicus]|uniref:tautomerase family protein n=1 Tax=Enterovibrio norvegicus TaxID=188144 RepID=UPI000C859F6B|nr:tautomerase family protein [Enterovibrio norvegicus]PMN67072.1 4-oxalocrotonate tautomerase [Enterovibrio norvegicus]